MPVEKDETQMMQWDGEKEKDQVLARSSGLNFLRSGHIKKKAPTTGFGMLRKKKMVSLQ